MSPFTIRSIPLIGSPFICRQMVRINQTMLKQNLDLTKNLPTQTYPNMGISDLHFGGPQFTCMEEATNQAELFMDPLFLDLHSLNLTARPRKCWFSRCYLSFRESKSRVWEFRNGRKPMENSASRFPPDG